MEDEKSWRGLEGLQKAPATTGQNEVKHWASIHRTAVLPTGRRSVSAAGIQWMPPGETLGTDPAEGGNPCTFPVADN